MTTDNVTPLKPGEDDGTREVPQLRLLDMRVTALDKAVELQRLLRELVQAEGKGDIETSTASALARMEDVIGELEPPWDTGD